MALLEFRNSRTFKKRQAVKVSERIGDFVVISVDFAYPVHRTAPVVRNQPMNDLGDDYSPCD